MIFGDNKQITKFATYTNFPSVGDVNLLYYDESANALYVWNGSSYVKGGQYIQVNTYSDLPDATTRTNQIWATIVDDGYRKKGLYKSNGTNWEAYVVSENAQEIWGYQDFAQGTITGTAITLTANNNDDSGTGYFAVGDIIAGTAGIFRTFGDGGLPAYTGALKIFSSKVKVNSQTADSITLSGIPHTSWGDLRIWYKIINRAGQGAYQIPSLTVQGSIFAEFTASLDASDIAFTPVGDIVGGDVAEACQELDQKKEKISNKENTTLDTSATKYPTNRLTKEYADSKVADTINDGITTVAPSQNAVFDALALKENNIGYTPENITNKDASGGYVGLTALKINFLNTLGTIASFFTNSNTATRTYTFQNKDGTIADLDDVATKENAFTTLGEAKGGTGQSTWTLGDLPYSSATNTLAKLSGNTTITKKFLSQIGNGTISAAPSWDALAKGDVGLSNVDNTADSSKPVSTTQQAALDTKFGKTTNAEISVLTSKTTPVDGDNILGEDSADSNSKIRILMSSLWTYIASKTGTLTNKTFDADGTGNSLTNIDNANIKSGAAIDASKIADGSISNSQFQLINELDKKYKVFAVSSNATAITVNTGTPTIIASVDITPETTTNKIKIEVTGDANANQAGGWHQLELYRDTTLIGKIIRLENAGGNSVNIPFAMIALDAPNTTSTITYSVKAYQGSGSFTYGETGDGEAPTIIATHLL